MGQRPHRADARVKSRHAASAQPMPFGGSETSRKSRFGISSDDEELLTAGSTTGKLTGPPQYPEQNEIMPSKKCISRAKTVARFPHCGRFADAPEEDLSRAPAERVSIDPPKGSALGPTTGAEMMAEPFPRRRLLENGSPDQALSCCSRIPEGSGCSIPWLPGCGADFAPRRGLPHYGPRPRPSGPASLVRRVARGFSRSSRV